MKAWLVIALTIGLLAVIFWPDGGKTYPPGVLLPDEPAQSGAPDKQWTLHEKYQVKALAAYDVKARVLSRKRYRSDPQAAVSPLDLFLGWGPMTDQAVIDQLRFSQYGRWAYWKCRQLPLTSAEIMHHSANTHIIPANKQVRQQCLRLGKGDLVQLRGYLVEVTNEHGEKWRSSLSRTDAKNGACEVFWVEEVKTLEP